MRLKPSPGGTPPLCAVDAEQDAPTSGRPGGKRRPLCVQELTASVAKETGGGGGGGGAEHKRASSYGLSSVIRRIGQSGE